MAGSSRFSQQERDQGQMRRSPGLVTRLVTQSVPSLIRPPGGAFFRIGRLTGMAAAEPERALGVAAPAFTP